MEIEKQYIWNIKAFKDMDKGHFKQTSLPRHLKYKQCKGEGTGHPTFSKHFIITKFTHTTTN